MNTDLSQLYIELNLSKHTIQHIENIRNSEPVRRVTGARSNINARYPSKKMQRTIQAESRTVELPYVLLCEHDENVLEYWDQPDIIKVSFRNNHNNKFVTIRHTPDYLVITRDSVYFVECKTQEELAKLSKKSTDRFVCNNGVWRSPAGERAATELGIGYRVIEPGQFTTNLIRNIRFLDDYFSITPSDIDLEQISKIITILKERKAISVAELSGMSTKRAVFLSIIKRDIYFDWHHDLLPRPQYARVYLEASYSKLDHAFSSKPTNSAVRIVSGDSLLWDSNQWKVINIGKKISLQCLNDKVISIEKTSLNQLLKSGDIKKINTSGENTNSSSLFNFNNEQIKSAIYKYKIATGEITEHQYTERTVREWKRLAERSRQINCTPYLGLIPRTDRRGNRNSKVSHKVLEKVLISIRNDYLLPKAPDIKSAYNLYKARQIKNHDDYVSYPCYIKNIKRLPEELVRQLREGSRSAYQSKQLTANTASNLPRHGDRAFQIAHIDHTELEICLVSGRTGHPLGRVWLSIMIDAYSRLILSYWLSFESPSIRSVVSLIRLCVERWNRLPEELSFDRGKEFESEFVEVLLPDHYITKISRPPGQPRFGSIVERAFLLIQEEFIHALIGNTQHRRMDRNQSATHDADKHAAWTPESFDERLCEFIHEVYPNKIHTGICDSPLNRFEQSLAESGQRDFRYISYDRNFIMSTFLPAPGRAGKRKLSQSGRIKLKHFEYLPATYIPEMPFGNDVDVKYDPYDVEHIYAYLHSEWHEFKCTNPLVHEYVELGIPVLHEEVLTRVKNAQKEYRNPSQRVLEFGLQVEEQEKVLLDQRYKKLLDEQIEEQPEVQKITGTIPEIRLTYLMEEHT